MVKIAVLTLNLVVVSVIFLTTKSDFAEAIKEPEGGLLAKLDLFRSMAEIFILIVAAIGYLKCSHIPVYTGAKRTAQFMLMLCISVVVLKVISRVIIKRNLFFQWPPMLGLSCLCIIVLISALVAIYFALFLRQTANYLQDHVLMNKSSIYFKLTFLNNMANVLWVYAIALKNFLPFTNLVIFQSEYWEKGLLIAFLIANIWAFLLSLQILYKMRSVIDHGTQ